MYMDSLGVDGGIGASAVMSRNGQTMHSLRYFLGTAAHHTEVVGMILGIELLCMEWGKRDNDGSGQSGSNWTHHVSLGQRRLTLNPQQHTTAG